jgi:hypothetical protein
MSQQHETISSFYAKARSMDGLSPRNLQAEYVIEDNLGFDKSGRLLYDTADRLVEKFNFTLLTTLLLKEANLDNLSELTNKANENKFQHLSALENLALGSAYLLYFYEESIQQAQEAPPTITR